MLRVDEPPRQNVSKQMVSCSATRRRTQGGATKNMSARVRRSRYPSRSRLARIEPLWQFALSGVVCVSLPPPNHIRSARRKKASCKPQTASTRQPWHLQPTYTGRTSPVENHRQASGQALFFLFFARNCSHARKVILRSLTGRPVDSAASKRIEGSRAERRTLGPSFQSIRPPGPPSDGPHPSLFAVDWTISNRRPCGMESGYKACRSP
jgi:hypothetical protein